MKSERVQFPGAAGHELAARWDRPDGRARASALFAHCFTCSKDLKAVARISRGLVERGISVFRFDFTGLGESEGDFAATTFSSNLGDLRAAIAFLASRGEAPELLVGHSLGGAAILTLAPEVESVRGVVTIAAPADTGHLRTTLLEVAPELGEGAAEAEVQLAGRPFRVRRELLDDLAEERVLAAARRLRVPLLVLHAPGDDVVPVDHARRIFEAARHPKSFVSLGSADHLLLDDPADARYVAELVSAWASRFVTGGEEAPPAAAPAVAEPLEPGVVVVSGKSGLAHVVRAGRHVLAADEPVAVGGTDTGPSPYDYLLAALGACTAMTLRLYADRKGWPLAGVDVRLRHRRIHAEDCADCETKAGRIDEIERELALSGDLDGEQKARLLEIADKCPVHRTLEGEIKVRTRLA